MISTGRRVLRSRVCVTMADPRLPTDVLIEVLIRLPVKSLLKSRCVSKSWRDLICSPLFIHMHLKYDRKQRVLLVKRYFLPENADVDDGILSSFPPRYTPVLNDLKIPTCSRTLFINMGLPSGNEEGEIFSFHDPDSPQVLVSPNLSIPSLNDLNKCSDPVPIHGPCNGLVCIGLGENVYLCNPALREFKLLPPRKFPENYAADSLGYGFWFDPIGGVYKVIQIWEITPEVLDFEDFVDYMAKSDIRIDMYNSASNSWKQIDAKVPDINYLAGLELFFNGTIHWYALTGPNNDYQCILCFDTSSEAFRQLGFQDNVSPPEIELVRLMELDDSLAMVWCYSEWTMMDQCDYVIEIWVMKEYGVKESWRKQFVVRPYCIFRPLLFKKNELFEFESDNGQLGVCTSHEKSRFKKFGFYGLRQSFSAVVYEESLISLNQIISSDRKNEGD